MLKWILKTCGLDLFDSGLGEMLGSREYGSGHMGCIMLTNGEVCGQMRKHQLMNAHVNHINRLHAINTIAALLQYRVSTYCCSCKSNIAVANGRKVYIKQFLIHCALPAYSTCAKNSFSFQMLVKWVLT
jgi:hypothetical protein